MEGDDEAQVEERRRRSEAAAPSASDSDDDAASTKKVVLLPLVLGVLVHRGFASPHRPLAGVSVGTGDGGRKGFCTYIEDERL